MDITLIMIGKTSTPWVKVGMEEYVRRLTHYVRFEIQELADVKRAGSLTEIQRKEAEGELILSRLKPGDFMILLDERGREYRTVEFADFLETRMLRGGAGRLVFVIGGPYGFSQGVYERADMKVSMSRMTFSHEMIRVIFVEQLYRAMTVLRGEKYHHE